MTKYAEAMIGAKVAEVMNKAKALFPIFHNVEIDHIKFYDKGTTAGYAGINAGGRYYLQFSTQAFEVDQNALLNDTVPHEVAHLVCFKMARAMGRTIPSHGKTWKSVCRQLGGTGERCHNMELKSARTRTRYEYVLASGDILLVTKMYHVRIQHGEIFHKLKTKELISKANYTRTITL